MKKTLLIIWSIVLVYITYTLVDYRIESNNNKEIYQELRGVYNKDIDIGVDDGIYIINIENEKTPMARYNSILSTNQDAVGWVRVPNTRIDYPILKTRDNDFYLNHNIHKQPSKAGSIFMDFRNVGLGEEHHTILYGHNMKDRSMFSDLVKYKNKDFLYNNPIIEFNTLYEEIKWEIFSVYITSVDFYYIETDFPSLRDYQAFLDSIKQRSIFDIDVDVSGEDQILTLSTCSFEFDDARWVIHAKKAQ